MDFNGINLAIKKSLNKGVVYISFVKILKVDIERSKKEGEEGEEEGGGRHITDRNLV